MGDRANVFVVDSWAPLTDDGELSGVYLYTHWSGYDLPDVLAKALDSKEGRGRWSDGSYLTRIIFDTMTGLEGGETGFGISASITDNSYDILVVNPQTETVAMVTPGKERSLAPHAKTWTFAEFASKRPGWRS